MLVQLYGCISLEEFNVCTGVRAWAPAHTQPIWIKLIVRLLSAMEICANFLSNEWKKTKWNNCSDFDDCANYFTCKMNCEFFIHDLNTKKKEKNCKKVSKSFGWIGLIVFSSDFFPHFVIFPTASVDSYWIYFFAFFCFVQNE